MTILGRLFPAPGETVYRGSNVALWLLGLLITIKLAISVNSILNTAKVAGGVDGVPLASFDAAATRTVLLFFSLWALGHLMLSLTALLALVRYRVFVPLSYSILFVEHGGRWLIAQSYATHSIGNSVPLYINACLLSLVAIGFILSLLPPRPRPRLSS